MTAEPLSLPSGAGEAVPAISGTSVPLRRRDRIVVRSPRRGHGQQQASAADVVAALRQAREKGAVEGPLATRLDVRDLDFYYGATHAVIGASLPLYDRRVTALIGPSGCGKSTLLRVLNGMYRLYPEQRATGTVLLDGENLLDPAIDINRLRAQIGMVFQKPTPFPMSIYDNIAFGVGLFERLSRQEMRARVEDALRRAALWEEVETILDQNGLSLSGGQQQRLCIARAIAINPEVMLFDEPCSALDPLSTTRIEALIEELKRRYTIVIVTHNMQQAARISDYTAFMYLGRVIEFGTTEQIFLHPKETQTEAYVTGRFG